MARIAAAVDPAAAGTDTKHRTGEPVREFGSIARKMRAAIERGGERVGVARELADLIRHAGGYRWVGLYDVDCGRGEVAIIGWSGPGAPAYPRFPIDRGLTATAIVSGKTVSVSDVRTDARYLTAFGNTRSEIIVPIVNGDRQVVGTLDVESDQVGAFDADAQRWLEGCAEVLRPFWLKTRVKGRFRAQA